MRAAALIHQSIEQVAGGLVLDGLVLAADDTQNVQAPVDGVGAHGRVEVRHGQGRWSGDAGVVDDGFLGHLQRHFADVPAGQVSGLQRLAGGHGVANRLAETVPGVGARVGEGGLTIGDIELVCHESCSFQEGCWFAPVSAGCGGTGGVAVSTPKRPAEKQEADFRHGEPGAQRLRASCHRAVKCRRCRAGAAGAGRGGRRERRTGEPAGRGLRATGSLTDHTWHPLTARRR